MDRATELNLAFDVDDLADARPGLTGDAGRASECEAADLDHAKTIDLAHALALSVDERDTLDDSLPCAVAQGEKRAERGLGERARCQRGR